ncbi:histamine H3 receptor-like [Anneissia japonica]|uniref:histamine H3 receptor-like n=1 Tax=Anneissia japonica TaxID=1529436 RepID=UPI001425AD3F|nr:histamine H3 receptor-like [Anneissia japonica]
MKMEEENGTLTSVNQKTMGIHIFVALLMSVLAIAAFLGNLLTIIVLVQYRFLLTNSCSNHHVLSLAVADIGVSVIALPSTLSVYLTGHWPFGVVLCIVKSILGSTLICVTMFTLVFISFDRYLLLSKDYPKYQRWQRNNVIKVQIIFVWVFPSVLWTINILLFVYEAEMNPTLDPFCNFHLYPSLIFKILYSVFLLFFPLLLLIFFSVQTFVLITRRIRQRRVGIYHPGALNNTVSQRVFQKITKETKQSSHNCSDSRTMTGQQVFEINESLHDNVKYSDNNDTHTQQHCQSADNMRGTSKTQQNSSSRRHRQLWKKQITKQRSIKRDYIRPAALLGALVSAFTFCLLPFSILGSVQAFRGVYDSESSWMYIHLTAYLNAFLNPLLYAATNIKIRAAIKKLIRKMCSSCTIRRCSTPRCSHVNSSFVHPIRRDNIIIDTKVRLNNGEL